VALQQIRKYQNLTTNLIHRQPFQRLVREIMLALNPDLRIQRNALEALQEAAEAAVVAEFEGK
jgi:histone H3